MPYTPTWGLYYPSLTPDAPNGPANMQELTRTIEVVFNRMKSQRKSATSTATVTVPPNTSSYTPTPSGFTGLNVVVFVPVSRVIWVSAGGDFGGTSDGLYMAHRVFKGGTTGTVVVGPKDTTSVHLNNVSGLALSLQRGVAIDLSQTAVVAGDTITVQLVFKNNDSTASGFIGEPSLSVDAAF